MLLLDNLSILLCDSAFPCQLARLIVALMTKVESLCNDISVVQKPKSHVDAL